MTLSVVSLFLVKLVTVMLLILEFRYIRAKLRRELHADQSVLPSIIRLTSLSFHVHHLFVSFLALLPIQAVFGSLICSRMFEG